MKRLFGNSGIAAGLGLLVMATGVRAQQQPPAAGQPSPQPAAHGQDLPGPVDSLQDLQDAGKMLFKLADTNNDGQISQKEATDAGNLVVGGFFFRADANGDGTVTPEEARQAREALFRQQPLLRFVVQRGGQAIKEETGKGNDKENRDSSATQNPARALGKLLDTNQDKKLEATEVRQAVQSTVEGLYATADTNRDGQLSPSEINAAIVGAARTAMQASFQAADTNNDGQLSKAEFDKAITEPANVLFAIVDANNDGQLSQQEIESARRTVAGQIRLLRVPEPANSPAHLIESGRRPGEVAPVPNFGTPRGNAPAAGTAPRPR